MDNFKALSSGPTRKLMLDSESISVLLITEDPMVEIALHHLFGAEQHKFELHSTIPFRALDRRSIMPGIRIVLADMSRLENVDQLEGLRHRLPGVPILCWCGSTVFEIAETLRGKCDGVISRLASSADLLAALATVSGEPGRSDCQVAAREFDIHLTYRESQLVALLARGFKNKEIAACLGITVGTVKVYLSTLFKKTGAKDRFELTLFGMKNSLYGQAEKSGPVPAPIAARRAMSRPVLTSIRLVQTEAQYSASTAVGVPCL